MSASGENAAPVIIKRKKVTGGDGHHGGAWKVAIAFSFTFGAFAPLQIRLQEETPSNVVLTSAGAFTVPRAIRFRTQAKEWTLSANGVLNRPHHVAEI